MFIGATGDIGYNVYPSGESKSAKPNADFDGAFAVLERLDGKTFNLVSFTMVLQADVSKNGNITSFELIGTHSNGATTKVSIANSVTQNATRTLHNTPQLTHVVKVQFGKSPTTTGYGSNVIRVDDIVTGNGVASCGDGDACKPNVCVEGWCTHPIGTRLSSGMIARHIIRNGALFARGGPNTDGTLGLGDTVNRAEETRVGMAANWKMVCAGGGFALAIKTDGSLWAWGKGADGALGPGDTSNRTTPTRVGSGNDWAVVNCGTNHTMAIKTNGTLWTWGDNTMGQLCMSGGKRTSPVQVGTDTNWSQDSQYVISGYTSTMAIKIDGTLWGCGQNEQGTLGMGHTSKVTGLKREVTNGTGFKHIASHRLTSVALQTDGTMWTAGQKDYGRLARSCSGTVLEVRPGMHQGQGLDAGGLRWLAYERAEHRRHAVEHRL